MEDAEAVRLLDDWEFGERFQQSSEVPSLTRDVYQHIASFLDAKTLVSFMRAAKITYQAAQRSVGAQRVLAEAKRSSELARRLRSLWDRTNYHSIVLSIVLKVGLVGLFLFLFLCFFFPLYVGGLGMWFILKKNYDYGGCFDKSETLRNVFFASSVQLIVIQFLLLMWVGGSVLKGFDNPQVKRVGTVILWLRVGPWFATLGGIICQLWVFFGCPNSLDRGVLATVFHLSITVSICWVVLLNIVHDFLQFIRHQQQQQQQQEQEQQQQEQEQEQDV